MLWRKGGGQRRLCDRKRKGDGDIVVVVSGRRSFCPVPSLYDDLARWLHPSHLIFQLSAFVVIIACRFLPLNLWPLQSLRSSIYRPFFPPYRRSRIVYSTSCTPKRRKYAAGQEKLIKSSIIFKYIILKKKIKYIILSWRFFFQYKKKIYFLKTYAT